MKVFQRIEVWILLLLAAGAGIFVMKSSSGDDERPPVIQNEVPATSEPASIRRRILERDHGNARLDLEVRVTNKHSKPMQLVPPFALLTNAAGKEVPAFFLPIEPPPTLAAKTTADVRLRFWLEASDLAGPLTLELDGEKLPVKSAKPLDLTKVENQKQTEMDGLEWNVVR